MSVPKEKMQYMDWGADGADHPANIAVDSEGKLWVTIFGMPPPDPPGQGPPDQPSHTVLRINPDGNQPEVMSRYDQLTNHPYDIVTGVIDGEEYVFVSSYGNYDGRGIGSVTKIKVGSDDNVYEWKNKYAYHCAAGITFGYVGDDPYLWVVNDYPYKGTEDYAGRLSKICAISGRYILNSDWPKERIGPNPVSVAYGYDGNDPTPYVWVAFSGPDVEWHNDQPSWGKIYKYDADKGERVTEGQWKDGRLQSLGKNPVSLIHAEQGDDTYLWITCPCSNSVTKVHASSGLAPDEWDVDLGEYLRPCSVYYDQANDIVYVSNYGDGRGGDFIKKGYISVLNADTGVCLGEKVADTEYPVSLMGLALTNDQIFAADYRTTGLYYSPIGAEYE